MKLFLSITLGLCMTLSYSNGQDENSERELAVKKVQWDFPTKEAIPKKWRISQLQFDEWLETVTFPGWELLHSDESEDFFFAIFRDDSHLILWQADRKKAFNNEGSSMRPVDQKAHPNAVLNPSKWVSLNYKLVSPTVKISGREQGDAHSIAPDFSGKLSVKASAGGKGKKSREILSKEIDWKIDWKAPKAD